MANKKISELTVAGVLTGDEKLEVVQDGENRQTTAQDIADLASPPGSSVESVTGSTVDNTDPANPIINADPDGAAATAESNANTYTDVAVSGIQDYIEGLIANVPAKKTVDVARITALPSYIVTPGSGSTRTLLTASVNGFFPTTDGILNDASNTIESFVATAETAGNAKYNGTYLLIDKGSASTKWIAQRTIDSQATLASNPVDLADVRIKRGTVNGGRTYRQTAINVIVDTTSQTWVDTRTLTLESLGYALSDEVTPLTVGLKLTYRMPYAFHVSAVRISLTTPQTTSVFVTVDVRKNGVTILSTLVSVDNNEYTSVTAAYPVVISVPDFADDDQVQFYITQVGAATVAAGLKAILIGYRI